MLEVLVAIGFVFALAAVIATIVGIFVSRARGRYWLVVPVLVISSLASCTAAIRTGLGRDSTPLPPAPFPEAATRFEGFPVYWLGLEFQGLPLTLVDTPAPRSSSKSVLLGYGGSCKAKGFEGSCTSVIYVEVQPACTPDARPNDVLVHVYGKGRPSRDELTLANPAFFSPVPLLGSAPNFATSFEQCGRLAAPTPVPTQ